VRGRELEEETGYRARSLKPLFECYAAPGYSGELIRVFLARGLKPTERSGKLLGRPAADEI